MKSQTALISLVTYRSISLERGKWSKCGMFYVLELCCDQTVWLFRLFSTVLKRFCPGDSKNVFVLVLPHIEPELELFEVWEIMVPQIIITLIANVINFKQLAWVHILTIFPVLEKLAHICWVLLPGPQQPCRHHHHLNLFIHRQSSCLVMPRPTLFTESALAW